MKSLKQYVFNTKFRVKQLSMRYLAMSFGLFFALLLTNAPVSAQGVNDFNIDSFNAKYELSNKDPQGFLTTTELIEVDFSGQNHGILRAIPKKYGSDDTKPHIISVKRDGRAEPYTTYTQSDNLVLKIGSGGVTITGQHSYEIQYTVENVIRFYDDHDELYWDVNGNDWLQNFSQVTATISSDKALQKTAQTFCYTGGYGSRSSNCTVATEGNSTIITTNMALGAKETLTFVESYKKGYFTPQTFYEKYRKYIPSIIVVLLQLAIFRNAFKKWDKYGKDYKGLGVVAPYFSRPKKVSVLEASYVAQNRLQPTSISATIIDLAIRGYIKITETNDKKPKHELTLIKLPDAQVAIEEKMLLEDLFSNLAVGSKVKLEDKKNKLYKTVSKLSKQVEKSTKEKGLYELTPTAGMVKFIPQFVLGAVALVLGVIFASSSFGVTALVGGAVLIIIVVMGMLMSKRSHSGNELKMHMTGLERYLSLSEKDRLKAHDSVAAPLSTKGAEPVRDVKFFEKLLPFAVVYGVEKSWADAFKDIYTEAPEWYSGNWSTFNTAVLASSLANTTTVAGASFSAPSSSGSSGGGGGGFSGGGGGGGGGGGW